MARNKGELGWAACPGGWEAKRLRFIQKWYAPAASLHAVHTYLESSKDYYTERHSYRAMPLTP